MPTDPRLNALETIRQRLCAEKELLDTAGAVVSGPSGAELVASMQGDGSWADVDYQDSHLKDWATANHLSRLQAMARGWALPESPLYRQETVFRAILRGLDFWYNRNPQNPNWWWNEIGAPLLLGNTLLFLKGDCDRSYIDRARPSFECQRPIHDYTGQNLVWVAWTRILYGLVSDNPGLVSDAYVAIGHEVHLFPEDEGIQPDMSFHQHGKLLYSGGYGSSFAADVTRLIAVAADTIYAWPSPLVDRIAAYVLDGCRWMVRGRTFDPSAIGREISREGHSAARFRVGLHHLASFAHPRQAEAQASADVKPTAGRSLVNGNRHFWCSDFMVQHRPSYYMSVHMTSRRLLNVDMACCGGEGRLCHHMAEGTLFMMRDGDEYRDLYPVWNWRQIPGTTVVQETGDFDPDALRGLGERVFAGGVSDGRIGCAAMDFARNDLTARKAWFFFDEGVVALGAGITAAANAPVRTTINQCHLRGQVFLDNADRPLTAGEYHLKAGTSFRHDGVTYRILDGAGTLRLGPQSGAWSDCGVGSTERLTLNVLNAGLDHGIRPAGATYAYAILPDDETGAACANDQAHYIIVNNEPALQAVWHADVNRGHAAFYEPGVVAFPDGQRIRVDQPCLLLYQPKGKTMIGLTLSQPEHRKGMITLQLEGKVKATLIISLMPGEYAGSSQTLVYHGGETSR